MKNFFSVCLLFVFVTSCGPSEQQVKEAAMNQMKAWIQQKAELEHQASELESTLQTNLNAYEDLIASIEAQKSKLQDLKGFKLLRTASEKEQQIKNQVKRIRELEAMVPKYESVIKEQQSSVSNLREIIEELSSKIEYPSTSIE